MPSPIARSPLALAMENPDQQVSPLRAMSAADPFVGSELPQGSYDAEGGQQFLNLLKAAGSGAADMMTPPSPETARQEFMGRVEAPASENLTEFGMQALPYVLPAARFFPKTVGAGAGLSAFFGGTSEAGESQDKKAIEDLQRKLKSAGYYEGEIDGEMGTKTRNANKAFMDDQQKQQELEVERAKAEAAKETALQKREEADRKAAQRTAGEERMREIEEQTPWYSQLIRDYGQLVGTGVGLGAGMLTRGLVKRGAESASKRIADRAEAVLAGKPKDVPDRVSRINQFWDEGGAGNKVPFRRSTTAPEGFEANPKAVPASDLYRPQPAVTGKDVGVMGFYGAEAGVSHEMANEARGRVEEARQRVSEDPSEVNIKSFQTAMDQAAAFEALSRMGVGGALGYGAGLAKSRPKHSRPNISAAEADRIRIDQLLTNGRPPTQPGPLSRMFRSGTQSPPVAAPSPGHGAPAAPVQSGLGPVRPVPPQAGQSARTPPARSRSGGPGQSSGSGASGKSLDQKHKDQIQKAFYAAAAKKGSADSITAADLGIKSRAGPMTPKNINEYLDKLRDIMKRTGMTPEQLDKARQAGMKFAIPGLIGVGAASGNEPSGQ